MHHQLQSLQMETDEWHFSGLTGNVCAIETHFGRFYARCIRNWNGSSGGGIIEFVIVIRFTVVWWRHVIVSSDGVSFVLYQDIN